MNKINMKEKFELINSYWEPKIVGEANDFYVKLAKFKDEFVWHDECIIIPKGVEHFPYAEEEVHVMLIEAKSTLNTGNVENEKTVKKLKTI